MRGRPGRPGRRISFRTALTVSQFATDTAVIKVSGTEIAGTITHVRNVWGEFNSNAPFSHTLMDETVGRPYAAEARLGRILRIFVSLAGGLCHNREKEANPNPAAAIRNE